MRAWRLVDSGPSEASLNMAIDEAIASSVREGLPPTLRFYGWDRPSVSIGCFQRAGELDLAYLGRAGIPLVRRPTGGRAVLHGEELTYSFSAGTIEGTFSAGLLESYVKLAAALSRALEALGLKTETRLERPPSRGARSPVCFQSTSYGEMAVEGRKVVGSAQKRWQDALLQQGSIPYSMDATLMEAVFPSGLAKDHMAGLREFLPGLEPGALKAAIRASFEEAFAIRLDEAPLSRKEEALAGELLERKYRSPAWNLRR